MGRALADPSEPATGAKAGLTQMGWKLRKSIEKLRRKQKRKGKGA